MLSLDSSYTAIFVADVISKFTRSSLTSMTWSGSAFLGGVLSDARDYRFPGAQGDGGLAGGT